jgi:Cft2 family RNA processing exonuclease
MALPTLQTLGAAGTVTGSKHLARVGGTAILLDCGLFQGLKPVERGVAADGATVALETATRKRAVG